MITRLFYRGRNPETGLLNNERGFSLVTVLLIVVLLAVMGITLNRTGGLQATISYNLKDSEETYSVAQAGFEHGLFMVKRTPSLRGTIADVPFGKGTYTIIIADVTSPKGNVAIKATGKIGSAEKTMEKTVKFGTIVTVYPTLTKDTDIDQGRRNKNCGVCTSLRIGARASNALRSLLEFDLSMIPAGAVIDTATFELYMYDRRRSFTNDNQNDIEVRRLTQSWNEGIENDEDCTNGATWKEYDCSNEWSTWGGDYTGSVETKTTVFYTDIDQWHQWDVKNLIQFWVDNPGQNLGMLLKDELEGSNDKRFEATFYSSEYSTPSLRPKLTVTYIPPDPD